MKLLLTLSLLLCFTSSTQAQGAGGIRFEDLDLTFEEFLDSSSLAMAQLLPCGEQTADEDTFELIVNNGIPSTPLYVFERLPNCEFQPRFRLFDNTDRIHRGAFEGASLFAILATGPSRGEFVSSFLLEEEGEQWDITSEVIAPLSTQDAGIIEGRPASAPSARKSIVVGTPSAESFESSVDEPVLQITPTDANPQESASIEQSNEGSSSMSQVAFGGAAVALLVAMGAVGFFVKKRRSTTPISKKETDGSSFDWPEKGMPSPLMTSLYKTSRNPTGSKTQEPDVFETLRRRSKSQLVFGGSNDLTVLSAYTHIQMPVSDDISTFDMKTNQDSGYAFSECTRDSTTVLVKSELTKADLALNMDRLNHILFPDALASPMDGQTLVGSSEKMDVFDTRSSSSSEFWSSMRGKARESKLYSFSFSGASSAGLGSARSSVVNQGVIGYTDWASDLKE
jgi:hypothetical protein